MVPGAWRCSIPVSEVGARGISRADPTYCSRCGATVDPHPVDVCLRCDHLVEFHGRDTEGCGRISAAGWCACRRSFGRDHADHVRYW